MRAFSPAVWMHIDKFGHEVLIEPDHPLAVAQRASNQANEAKAVSEVPAVPDIPVVETTAAAPTTDTQPGVSPAVTVRPVASGPHGNSSSKRKRAP